MPDNALALRTQVSERLFHSHTCGTCHREWRAIVGKQCPQCGTPVVAPKAVLLPAGPADEVGYPDFQEWAGLT